MTKKRNVGIFIFDGAEVLDFAGPFEVFAVASEVHDHGLFDVFTVGEQLKPVSAVNGFSVNPTYDFNTCPRIDILVIPGGFGTRQQIENTSVLKWIKKNHQNSELTLSVCSGSTLLGALGILDGQAYCTHHEVYERMQNIVPTGMPQKDKRFVGFGKVFTSAGISAGIDLSFHVVETLHGKDIADQTAKYMEYEKLN